MNPPNFFNQWLDNAMRDVFEPSLNWVLSHPIISVLAVAVLIFFRSEITVCSNKVVSALPWHAYTTISSPFL
jgi:hypothetical protein